MAKKNFREVEEAGRQARRQIGGSKEADKKNIELEMVRLGYWIKNLSNLETWCQILDQSLAYF